jgi:hypothetical protein
MTLSKLQMRPGVNREGSNYSGEGGWFYCDKIRFRSGYPEKLGGWAQIAQGYTYKGVCRALISWQDLSSNNYIGVGTNLKYYVFIGSYHDITPIRKAVTPMGNNPFASTLGSPVLRVTDTNHGANADDFVTYAGATGFDGYSAAELNIEFQILKVIDANTYLITADRDATLTTTGGGAAVDATYQISVGQDVFSIGNGWGAGVWNGANKDGVSTTLAYTSGTGSTLLTDSSTIVNVASTTGFLSSGTVLIDNELISYAGKSSNAFTGCTRGVSNTGAVNHNLYPSPTPAPISVYQVTSLLGNTPWGGGTGIESNVPVQLRLWTHDTFGKYLLMAPRGGAIYLWENDITSFVPAVTLASDATIHGFDGTQVPVKTNQVIISDVSRFLIAMGSNSYNPSPDPTFDPMLVRWSDQENIYQWIPDITNQAGEQRLTNGSYIVCAKKNRQEIIIWTDSAVYSMQYIGPPYVWGINMIMDNLSIMAPNAVIVVNNIAYWMGMDKFYSYSGRVETLPCSLKQYIYNDLCQAQSFQITCGSNEGFNEVWWFYVSNDEADAATIEGRSPLPDRYVIYNHLERIWYYGTMRRTYWLDSALRPFPMAAQGVVGNESNEGVLLYHETGVDDLSTKTPQPIAAYIQSDDFDIDDGEHFGFVWRMIPDITFLGSNSGFPKAYIQLKARNFPGASYSNTANELVESEQPYSATVKEYEVEQYTQQIYPRLRGRQMSVKVSSQDIGVAWQLGSLRIGGRMDGRK